MVFRRWAERLLEVETCLGPGCSRPRSDKLEVEKSVRRLRLSAPLLPLLWWLPLMLMLVSLVLMLLW